MCYIPSISLSWKGIPLEPPNRFCQLTEQYTLEPRITFLTWRDVIYHLYRLSSVVKLQSGETPYHWTSRATCNFKGLAIFCLSCNHYDFFILYCICVCSQLLQLCVGVCVYLCIVFFCIIAIGCVACMFVFQNGCSQVL